MKADFKTIALVGKFNTPACTETDEPRLRGSRGDGFVYFDAQSIDATEVEHCDGSASWERPTL